MHIDPIAQVVLSLGIILIASKFGGHFASRIKQPPVLGELIAGVILGNLALAGFTGLDYLKQDAAIDMLSRIGVILLLFQVGLESTIAQMLQVGLSSFLVASLGVVGPFVLGWGAGIWLLPSASSFTHAFIGATLTATSVGITARVLKDLGRSNSNEARVILGAAVIDDVLGLVILAVMTGILTSTGNGGASLSLAAIALILLKASVFLMGSLAIGCYLSPRLFRLASKLETQGVLLAVGLGFCFVVSWLASAIGLAPIVGAFSAGLILEDLHYRDFINRGERTLDELVEPISSFLVPVFFVLMGMRTDLRSLARPGVFAVSAALICAAIIGKQLCVLGIIGRGFNKVAVGLGMVPRGEVGLIFANLGLTLTMAGKHIMDQNLFSAIVIMVIVTTLIAPPSLKWSFERSSATVRFPATVPPNAQQPALGGAGAGETGA